MTYLHYIGIDVSKEWFDVAFFSQASEKGRDVKRFDNNKTGIARFSREHHQALSQGLTVLEATGGYELALLIAFSDKDYKLHRASGYHTRQFANSLKQRAKTDRQDALTLARYAYERREILPLYLLPTEEYRKFVAFSTRIADLKKDCVAEKNRLQNPLYSYFKVELRKSIASLTKQIEKYETEMRQIVEKNDEMSVKVETLSAMKGIAEKTAYLLLAHLPELGRLSSKQVAALAGVAPHERSSGKYTGHARVCGGRAVIRTALHLCALSAARFDKSLKTFYEGLISRGKSKMAATCAVARKLIVIANAKIRDALKEAETPVLKEIAA